MLAGRDHERINKASPLTPRRYCADRARHVNPDESTRQALSHRS